VTYNSAVPTPFYHIDLAERLLDDPELAPGIRERLLGSKPAFLFGNTAPDYVTLARLPRKEGHFFDVPIRRMEPAHRRLLGQFPELSRPTHLPDDQAAFLAGYLAHLWLDQVWIVGIFEPIFGPTVRRDTFRQRLLDHNLLRAHMDRDARRHLPSGLGVTLSSASPSEWLPFAGDQALFAWRDHLAEQLAPGGHSRTIDVFASRHGISSSEFTHYLESKQSMANAVFRHLPQETLARLQSLWLSRSVELVNNYLSEDQLPAPHVNLPLREQVAPQQLEGGR
jgi:hypothetical protein